MDISFLVHDKPPRSVKPSPGTQVTIPANKGSGSFDVAADVGTGSVKRSHAQMTGETVPTDEDRDPKKPRLSERSSPTHDDTFNRRAGNASPPLPAANFKKIVMPALAPYILAETKAATQPTPSYAEAGNMPAQHWQQLEPTHTASYVVSDSHFSAPMLPTFLPSHMLFPGLNGMPSWLLVAGAAEASDPIPTISTQGGAEAMLNMSTASLSGADDGSVDPHASLKFEKLYEHVKSRSGGSQVQASKEKSIVFEPMWKVSEERKVKDSAKRSDPRSALPRNTNAALPLLDQLQAAETGSSVVAHRWKQLQPALDKFLMSCAMFTKPEEFADYLAVVQIAVLYLDAPLGNGTSWQAEVVIADALVLLGRWAKTIRSRKAKSEQEKNATAERCKTAMRESLFGVDRDEKRVDHALSARFIHLLIKVYHFQFTEQRLSKLYERPLSNGRNQLPLVSAAKAARSFLENGEYKELS